MSATDFSPLDWALALAPFAGWPEQPKKTTWLDWIEDLRTRGRAWRARRETVRALQALDARTLKDIGIAATEIESVVYSDGGDRRRGYDRNWWRKDRARDQAEGKASRPCAAAMAKA